MVLGLGDSLLVGPEEGAFGVRPQVWAQWLAELLDEGFHRVAQPGAVTPWIAAELLPRARFAYSLACVHTGTNDVRSVDWDADRFEAALATVLSGVAERAARVCVATIPLDLGRPRAGAKVADANAIIRRRAAEAGAVVVGLDDLRGWRLLFPDAVHPTALGQLEVARRAALALRIERSPLVLAPPARGWRADVRYATLRQVLHLGRHARARWAERA